MYDRCLSRARGVALSSASGFSLPEAMAVLVIIALAATVTVGSFRSMLAPLRRADEQLEALLVQTRARAMVTTTPHRVRAATTGALVVEHALTCSSESWNADPRLGLVLPDGVTLTEDSWNICFDTRGMASVNMVLTLHHPRDGERDIEVLRGGTLRRLG